LRFLVMVCHSQKHAQLIHANPLIRPKIRPAASFRSLNFEFRNTWCEAIHLIVAKTLHFLVLVLAKICAHRVGILERFRFVLFRFPFVFSRIHFFFKKKNLGPKFASVSDVMAEMGRKDHGEFLHIVWGFSEDFVLLCFVLLFFYIEFIIFFKFRDIIRICERRLFFLEFIIFF
jgi:hypothetical protein